MGGPKPLPAISPPLAREFAVHASSVNFEEHCRVLAVGLRMTCRGITNEFPLDFLAITYGSLGFAKGLTCDFQKITWDCQAMTQASGDGSSGN